MIHLNNGKIVIIADVHQNISYVEKVLESEQNFDSLVFLGDYIDNFLEPDNKTIFTVAKTVKWIEETSKKLGSRAVWLLGNHDCAYVASYIPRSYNTVSNYGYFCSGWTKSKASEFNKYADPEWVRNLQLCCKVGDYYLSHAGFHYDHFQPFLSEQDNINKIYEKWEKEKSTFMNSPFHWIYEVGFCRGGYSKIGSPIWLDWNYEFQPLENVNQIVGHTINENVRFKGENICLDANQTAYAVWENGKIELKTI